MCHNSENRALPRPFRAAFSGMNRVLCLAEGDTFFGFFFFANFVVGRLKCANKITIM